MKSSAMSNPDATSATPAAPTSQRVLWAVVAALGATTLVLGAALVHYRSANEGVSAALTPATTATTAAPAVPAPAPPVVQTAPAQPATPASVQAPEKTKKSPVTHAKSVQTAPKTVAKQTPVAEPKATERLPERDPSWEPVAAAPAPAPKVVCTRCGTVESVTPIQREAAASGAGAAVGAVLGGLLGNQVGGGDGKTLATIAGVLGGGFAGHAVEKKMKQETVYQVTVRMDDGSLRHLEQGSPVAVGARVTVEGNTLSPASPATTTAPHTAP